MGEEVKHLLSLGRKLEAVRLVHKSLACSLEEAKHYVDSIERGENRDGTSQDIYKGWHITYKGNEAVGITVTDEYGQHKVRKGSPEWDAIIAESRQKDTERLFRRIQVFGNVYAIRMGINKKEHLR